MAKWFDETILIKYWEDRCDHYSLGGGQVGVKNAKRNAAFGAYPDISHNYLSDGRVVPAEIEWLTTNFDRHRHDPEVLQKNDGFLIVFERDSSFSVEQVEIDKADFSAWFETHAPEICQETHQ